MALDPEADQVLEFFLEHDDASWGDVLHHFWDRPDWPKAGDRLSELLVELCDHDLLVRYMRPIGDNEHARWRLTDDGRDRLRYLVRPPLPGTRSRPSTLSA